MIRITSEQFSSDIDRSMTMLDKYINDIIRSCFIKEGRNYDPLCFCYRYIVVETHAGNRILYSVHAWFKYQRVWSEFNRRMHRYLYDSTSIIYNKLDSNNEHVSFGLGTDHRVDINFSEAAFELDSNTSGKRKYVTLDIYDTYYDDMPSGECMPSLRYEKLLFKYRGINADEYKSIQEKNCNDPRLHLPNIYHESWERFYKLFVETFGVEPGSKYKFICGPGVKRVEVRADEEKS